MRALEFRAWNTARNCWTSRVELDGGWGKPMFMHGEIENGSGYQTDNTIIEQYTGLKDKNGKEIYEGDIVKGSWLCGKDKHIVKYEDYGFYPFIVTDFDGDSMVRNADIEIIGNIHENPELLEEGE